MGAQDGADVANAERLSIKFHDYADLTGDYRIDADGTISIPVIGRVAVNGMSPLQLETVLAERVTSVTGREAYVTVEIAGYRPVFVSGYVSHPGAYSLAARHDSAPRAGASRRDAPRDQCNKRHSRR